MPFFAESCCWNRSVALTTYSGFHIRNRRSVGLSEAEIGRVVGFIVARLGNQCDLKNVIDLARYPLHEPPVPAHWRRRMLSWGSGEPTRAIRSTVIAQAFQSISYPIFFLLTMATDNESEGSVSRRDVTWTRRHHSLFAPRDFDISPYFSVIKPTSEDSFDFRAMKWLESGAGDIAASMAEQSAPNADGA